jgi:hypothetical protein
MNAAPDGSKGRLIADDEGLPWAEGSRHDGGNVKASHFSVARLIAALVLGIGLAVLCPSGALAGSVSSTVVPWYSEGGDAGLEQRIVFRALPGESNRLEVRVTVDSISFRERESELVTSGPGCEQRSPQEALCPVAVNSSDPSHFVAVRALTVDHNDQVAVDAGPLQRLRVEVDGGPGDDMLTSSLTGGCCVWLFGNRGQDSLLGGPADDRLEGGPANDMVRAGAGDDYVVGGGGADRLDGGPGRDVSSYRDARRRVVVSLANPQLNKNAADGDRVQRLEDVEGSRRSDVIVGNHRGNRLLGGEGHDRVEGRRGPDVLSGDEDDRLFGGPGNDVLSPLSADLHCGRGQDATPDPDLVEAAYIRKLDASCEWFGQETTLSDIWVARALRHRGDALRLTLWSRGVAEAVDVHATVTPPNSRRLLARTATSLDPGRARAIAMPLTAAGKRYVARRPAMVELVAYSNAWGWVYEGPIELRAPSKALTATAGQAGQVQGPATASSCLSDGFLSARLLRVHGNPAAHRTGVTSVCPRISSTRAP